jgi:tRNA-2-methylthio-N6-dimethylallyladenosine synthase
MGGSFDIRLESLTGAPAVTPHAAAATSDEHAQGLPSTFAIPLTSDGTRGTFFLETFGCQMNEHDSEKVAGVLLARGYRQVETPEAASLILYNTCSIREKAAQKVFSRLGVYRDTFAKGGYGTLSNVDAAAGQSLGNKPKIGVLGCVAQQEGERIFSRAPWVSLVCGSASYRNLPQMLARLEAGEERVTGLDNDTDETFETEVTRRDNPWRAYITIIEGCDKACAYCVVPFTRGPERSRDSARVLAELRSLAGMGYSEVQFLGQTVNSYADPSPRRMRFSELLLEAAQVSGIRRLRFTTSHPRDFTPDIVEAIDAHPVLSNHVHLPVQSGSSRVLRAMQRTYSRAEYLEKIAMIRAAKRHIAVTTDVIVGFPGETDADFDETLSLLDEVKYEGVFSFKYSPRPNTPATSMPDAIPEEEKSRRLAVLMERQRAIQVDALSKLQNQIFEVHVDGQSKKENHWYGHSSCNRVVNFSSTNATILGQYVPVRVTGCTPNSLLGEHTATL